MSAMARWTRHGSNQAGFLACGGQHPEDHILAHIMQQPAEKPVVLICAKGVDNPSRGKAHNKRVSR